MSVKRVCPCDVDGICPYDAQYSHDCEWWCGAEEPEDNPDAEFYTHEDMEVFEGDYFCEA